MASKRSSNLIPFEFRVTSDEKLRYKQMAADAGISLSELVRRAIDNLVDDAETGSLPIASGIHTSVKQG
jgi:hypothetical protein